jgi:hypothetical protein
VVEGSAFRGIGQHIKVGGPYMKGPVVEIVGVAADVHQYGLDISSAPEIYFPAAQRVDGAMVVMIRTRGNPENMAAAVRRTLASIDGNVPIQSLKTADMWLGATLQQRRFTTLSAGSVRGDCGDSGQHWLLWGFQLLDQLPEAGDCHSHGNGSGNDRHPASHWKAGGAVGRDWIGGRARRKLGRIAMAEQPGLRSLHTRSGCVLLRGVGRVPDRIALSGGSALARHAD